jgi:hypothetical protein
VKGEFSMKKLSIYLFVVALIALVASLGTAAEKYDAPHTYKAVLSGSMVVPPAKTMAKGMATFVPEKGETELHYKLTVEDIENVTAAHIHLGKRGKNGAPVVGLFAGPKKEGKFSGTLAEGTITQNELVGSLSGKTIKDMIKMIRAGDLYVNVHTDKYPDGELRGQIR